jgi:drug/metabolite transporter (DMT)-like permease
MPNPQMPRTLTFSLTLLAMIAFAGNSLLCRLALKDTGIDAASFTSIRIASGALALWLIVRLRGGARVTSGSWPSALALFAYAACFSFAYISLPAATGALLLFGAVQATMIGYGLWTGERLRMRQSTGLFCASAGLVGLMLPGVSAPPLLSSLLMLSAGIAWGVYSLRGKGVPDPTGAIAMSAIALPWVALDRNGVCYAIASGALTSGVGYAIWYTALRGLKATSAAAVQLSVPVFAAIGGIAFLGEAISLRLLIASTAILGGIALVIVESSAKPQLR